ncbi:MAG: hypothetical protein HFG00_06200 [Oscillibacter sp.]|nr:hypothetical protein [Oscillibacter sp.]
MSMVQQLILAVANAERQIDGQIGQLTAYVTELDHVTGRVSSALAGSTQEHERQMLQQLAATRAEVRQSIEQLQATKGMLAHVRLI